MDDLLNEFLTETAESIDVVDVELVKLEQEPNNKEVLDNIFRLVHTIKGTCGFLGLPRLESVAHASENVLGKFRDGELDVTEHSVTVILESLDRIKEILAGLEATEQEPDGDDIELINRLDAIAMGEDADAARSPEPEAETVEGEIVDPGLGRTIKPGEVSLEELEAAFANAPGPGDDGFDAPDKTPDAALTAKDARGGGASRSLFDRIGGEDAIAVATNSLMNKVTSDTMVNKFFKNQDAPALSAKFTGMLAALFQDDCDTAENVAAHLAQSDGFGDTEFERFVELAKNAFSDCNVESDVCDEVAMSLELCRGAATAKAKSLAAKQSKTAAKNISTKADGGEARKSSNQSIRVSVDVLEDLMNMVSELVLTRNQLIQLSRTQEDNEMLIPLQRLSQCTTELQEGVMKTRMQPIGNAWAKLPRIVRDLTIELDKKIDLNMLGADTELDRQVLELIKDPLTHMVRNSADHGIEGPKERMALGKPETGTIKLNAYHEGGHIIIEIADDGRGLSVSKLSGKAVEKGLATEAELADMSDAQVQHFIFHPGFSTAAAVTSVSGRGVGMDVVRSNIEKIGGTIDMQSKEGSGTTFLIKIPLTLAIVSALIVQAHEERFAIPQISVLELVRASNNSEHRIETVKDTPVLRLRNRLLPLIYLNDVLGFSKAEDHQTENNDDFIVVTQVGAFTFGIVVDRVFDTEEIVVKPVAPILKGISVYSGNTILGDGSVIMILDPNGVASHANAGMTDMDSTEDQDEATDSAGIDRKEIDSLLLFRAGTGVKQKAVPLSLVARLEDFSADQIEFADGRYVVQYRGSLMPIVLADTTMNIAETGRQPVLVFTDREYTMGLAVDEILDIVEEHMEINIISATQGVVGSAIIEGQATEIADVAFFLSQAFSNWLKSRDLSDEGAPSANMSILLVDDSDFFRHMLKPVLTVAGYKVTTVDGGAAALALRDNGSMFDAIISDIEMPDMNGFELAEAIREGGQWIETPLLALSSLASERDIERGRKAGFDDYIAKFDKETLLQALSMQLKIRGDAA